MTEMKPKKQLAHLFNATRCIGCTACMNACAQTNYGDVMASGKPIHGRVMPGNIQKIVMDGNRRPFQIMSQCQQCTDAPCIKACPYDARWSNPLTGLPEKCMGEGCQKLVAEGKDPACVAACPTNARVFGDILDPESAISREIASSRTVKLLEEKGTLPNFFVEVAK